MAKLSQIPPDSHFAIIEEMTIHTPGDERSRTNPGHGYPASSETYLVYRPFSNRTEWEIQISMLTKRREKFTAISAEPATVTTTISVNI